MLIFLREEIKFISVKRNLTVLGFPINPQFGRAFWCACRLVAERVSEEYKQKYLKMSRRYEEGRTHTADTFLDFTFDLLDYAMPKYGCFWVPPPFYERQSKKIFMERFGEAVLLFRSRHSREFNHILSSLHHLKSPDDIQTYAGVFIRSIFKGHIPLMEFIAYCAFLIDIALVCDTLDDLDVLYTVAEDTIDVFHLYIKPYFTIIGGWHALFRMSEQYLMYMDFEFQNNRGESVAKKDFDSLKLVDINKF